MIMEETELAAMAVLRLQNPSFDEVKLSEAYEIAGSRRWLDWHIKNNNIRGARRGTAKNSPIFFSRFEIAALKRAEKEMEATIQWRKTTTKPITD